MEPTLGQRIAPIASSAWIDPSGKFYYVGDAKHYAVALDVLGDPTGGERLEAEGWVHFSYTGCHHRRSLTQAQMDTLFDILMATVENPHPSSYYNREYATHAKRALDIS